MTPDQPPTAVSIQYAQALGYGWQRMKALLFQPFLIERWFVLGFVAWLAGFNPSTGGGVNVPSGDFGGFEGFNPSDGGSESSLVVHSGSTWMRAWAWLTQSVGAVVHRAVQETPWDDFDIPGFDGQFTGALVGCLALFAVGVCGLGILFVWLNSRFQFIYIDDLVNNRHLVQEPWRRYKEQGNSLFFFQILFGIAVGIAALLVALVIVLILTGGAGLSELGDSWAPAAGSVFAVIAIGVAMLPVFIGLIFFNYCLRAFIVPIMVKDSTLRTTAAIGKFWRLFKSRPGPFLLYALMVLGIEFLLGLGLFIVGLMTCCIGLLLLMLPYIGAVIILPLTSWMRYSSLAFLRQFGPEYDVIVPDDPQPPYDEPSSMAAIA